MEKNLQIAPVDVFEHPSKEEARIFFYETVVRAAEDAGDKPIIEYVGSDDSEDRYGSIIDPRGWETEPYMRSGSGVVLWAHNYGVPPVGRTLKLKKTDKALLFTVEFATKQSEFARQIYELVRDGFLPGVSVGFIPKAAEEFEATTVNTYFAENKRYIKQELLELSIVPVPACRGALKKAYADGRLSDQTIEIGGLRSFMLGGGISLVRAGVAPVEMAKKEHKLDDNGYCVDDCPMEGDHKVEKKSEKKNVIGEMREWIWQDDNLNIEITEEIKATEIATMNALAESAVKTVMDGIDGWTSAKHAPLRWMCRRAVFNGMDLYDDIRHNMKIWYKTEPGTQLDEDIANSIDAEERARVQGVVRNVYPGGISKDAGDLLTEVRKGAKLSKKNKEKIKEALKLLEELDGILEEETDDAADKATEKSAQGAENAGEQQEKTPANSQTELVSGTSGEQAAPDESKRVVDKWTDVVAQFRAELISPNGSGVNGDVSRNDTAQGEQTTGSGTASSPKRSYLEEIMGRSN